MRLSEKTIELSYCSQFGALLGPNIIWFGLTQKQEARAGFDACTELGGRLIIFQFKALTHDVNGARRFYAKHSQLLNLKRVAGRCMRSVFYVLPMTGTTQELVSARGSLLPNSYLLDVATMSHVPAPTTKKGGARKSGWHYIDVNRAQTQNPVATIHSEPLEVPLIRASDFIESKFQGSDGFQMNEKNLYSNLFSGSAIGAIVPSSFLTRRY